jgi:hypothetical protein
MNGRRAVGRPDPELLFLPIAILGVMFVLALVLGPRSTL